ncbi:MAG: aminopeptidase P family protein [Defluviitaleaceae bacterium]|nr:aminopeptidase P family protein [Defluviitaleaceae bacterium]MCL2836532.1 aminopeptidase P family protein [Defluviitaleaceae bacterium]
MFKENRKNFVKEMDDSSLYIAFAGKAALRTADQFYPFTPKRNFYYLTGIEEPVVMLTIFKNAEGEATETLYLERYDELVAKWDGAALNKEDAEEISGIEKFREIEQFESDIARILFNVDKLNVLIDLENRYFAPGHTPEMLFAARIRDSYPHIVVENAYPVLAKLRTVKSKAEVKQIKKACQLTGEALKLMMQNSKPGMMEYEYTAYFEYHMRMAGITEPGFGTIAASGKNATILHYKKNTDKTNDGDLILFDLGARCGLYSADISRTFPVNGVFSPRQKELYNIVLGALEKVCAKIKPGVKHKELNEAVLEHYEKELKRIGLIKEKEEIVKYYYHGVSHHLGLDVHDAFRMKDGELKKGMVLTVEPGLYIAEENIGIRIEDNVLVTSEGCEVLSAGIARTVQEIEAVMAKKPVPRNKRVK